MVMAHGHNLKAKEELALEIQAFESMQAMSAWQRFLSIKQARRVGRSELDGPGNAGMLAHARINCSCYIKQRQVVMKESFGKHWSKLHQMAVKQSRMRLCWRA